MYINGDGTRKAVGHHRLAPPPAGASPDYRVADVGCLPETGPEIAVVIPTFNRPERCAVLLASLSRQTLPPARFEVIVVDDCSTEAEDPVATLKALAPDLPYRLQVLQTRSNRGPGPARNVGWRAATAPLVAFTDDDCRPEAGWLEAGLTHLQAHPEVGVAQGRTRPPDGVDVHQLQGWYVWRVIPAPSPYFDACNVFFRRRALDRAGGFDEEIGWWPSFGWPGAVPVAWGEDTAAAWAVIEDGWDRGFVADAVVIHEVEWRGLWWHVKYGYLDRVIVALAAAHPGYRREAFWRRWAYRREDAAFSLAVAGLVAATRWRPAALAVAPYLWWRRPSLRKPNFVPTCLGYVAVDTARAAGRLSGAIKYRTLVL
ncbi:MAG: glycosyltransferase family 2 protein [Actinomycetota bacterium]|nr:glycosyltransferase family 2 protein [Actinomycetota bacterium]